MALVNGELGENNVVPEEFHVGREFCLQYYTILTKNTGNIHRFYDDDSQMTRGSSDINLSRSSGEQEPIIPARGQKEIHARMMEENLRNAKVKVLQFDVQKVAGDSQLLAIQVCGELTNDGGPMRRFMESFVLKRLDAKKCYVVNNIFRFQDQVFCNGTEESNGSENLNTTGTSDSAVTTGEQSINEVPISDNLASQATMAAASGDEDSCKETNEVTPNKDESNTQLSSLADEADVQKSFEMESNDLVEINVAKEDVELPDVSKSDDKLTVEEKDEEDIQQESVALALNTTNFTESGKTNAPSGRSWANLVRQGINSAPPKSPSIPPARAPRPTPLTQPVASQPMANNLQETTAGPSTNPPVESSRISKGQRESTPNPSIGENSVTATGSSAAEKTKFPDNVQVFVGNIPIAMKSDILKEFFNTYGEVVDVRINVSKSNGRLPNFGFVIFKSPETVQNVLIKRPIYIDNHRLNVEEKKPNGNRGPRQPMTSGGPGGGPNRNGFGPRPRRP